MWLQDADREHMMPKPAGVLVLWRKEGRGRAESKGCTGRQPGKLCLRLLGCTWIWPLSPAKRPGPCCFRLGMMTTPQTGVCAQVVGAQETRGPHGEEVLRKGCDSSQGPGVFRAAVHRDRFLSQTETKQKAISEAGSDSRTRQQTRAHRTASRLPNDRGPCRLAP